MILGLVWNVSDRQNTLVLVVESRSSWCSYPRMSREEAIRGGSLVKVVWLKIRLCVESMHRTRNRRCLVRSGFGHVRS